MGNNESTPLEDISKDQVVQRVSGLGDKFANYAAAIDENGVDGDLLAGMNEDEFQETLDDLGVTSRLHRRKLLQEFRKTFSTGPPTNISRESTYSSAGSSYSGGSLTGPENVVLPAKGPVEEVHITDIEFRSNDYPYPDELSEGEFRHSRDLPTYNQGIATEEQQSHLAPDFWDKIDSVEGGYRPPIPEDDMERVAQVQSYGLEEIEPESDVAKTLTGYVEMATKLFSFDFGDITFFDHQSQFSFARVGLTDHIKEAIIGKVYTPLNYAADGTNAFLCKTDRSIGICNYPSLSKRTFVVHDIHKDETFKWMKTVWPFRCYVGTPLLAPSGLVLGTLCLHNLEPRPDFSKAHEVQLEQVARMVVQAIENWSLRRSIDRLEQERKLVTNNDSKMAPPKEHAVFVLTDIEGSTHMWEANSKAMKKALDLHDEIVRKLRVEHSGYEVDTEGDSFLLAFHDAVDAFGFSLGLQQQLYDAPWADDILKLPSARDDGNAFRGLRVRVGVEMGPVTVKENKVTGRTQYKGKTLEMVKGVESMAQGGQILTTFDTWNAASFLAETKLNSPQVVDLGTHVVRKGKILSEGVISKRILQLVPAPLAIKYSELTNANERAASDLKGRRFPEIKSLKKLSKSFYDAPEGEEVTIAFIGCGEIETRYKESAGIIAEVIAHASSLLPGTEGYQCQNNMFAFPNITEAVKFGLRFMDLMRAQKPLEDGAQISRLVTYGCVHDAFVALEPHKTTGRADYFGKVVNRAARVAYTSSLGKVCIGVTSAYAFNESAFHVDDPTVRVNFIAMKQLKGVEEEMAIFECKRRRSASKAVLRWFGYKEKDDA